MRAPIARPHAGLGQTRNLIPLGQKLWAQLIGTGTRFAFKAADIQGWDLALVHHAGLRHAFNKQSLVELWLETAAGEAPIYCMGKFLQQQNLNTCVVRIVEIDGENLERLQAILDQNQPESLVVTA